MTTLNLASLPVDLRALAALASHRNFGTDAGRALHHLLGEMFGKALLQPFRLMVAPGARMATLYAYTAAGEETLRERLSCAAPECVRMIGEEGLALRSMPAEWRPGRRLGFDLRIRPVRRLMSPLAGWSREEHRRALAGKPRLGPMRKGAEVDAFLVARLRAKPEGPPDPDEAAALTRETVYRDWLAERLAGAAILDPGRTQMARHQRTRLQRRAADGGEAHPEGPDATFHGELTVTDGAAFARLLARGVGRHTAYGFGMLLLRPPAD